MNNKQVAQNWREQTKDNGHSLNMFFEQEVIYSYGYHFPMAYITKETYNGKTIVLQNSDRYSNTTARHLHHMRMECIGDAIVEMPTDLLKQFIKCLTYPMLTQEVKNEVRSYLEKELGATEKKLVKARKDWSKEMYQRDIDNYREQIRALEVI